MTVLQNPSITSSLLPSFNAAGLNSQKVLFIGQMRETAPAVSGELVENILNDNSWNISFGENSMLSAMIRAARLINQVTQFDAIALDDNGSGASATGSFLFTGTATSSGVLDFFVGSKKNNRYVLPVTAGDTSTSLATALAGIISLDARSPVFAASSTGTVDLEAANGGNYGNTIGLSSDGAVEGIAVTITAMSGGAVDPVLTGLFDVIGDTRYQAIVWPYESDLNALTSFLDPRFNVDNNILDGVGFVGMTSTLAAAIAALSAENSPSLCVNVDKLETSTARYKGPSVLEIPVVKAAQFAAVRALRLTEGANIGSIVITRSARDSFGGPALASKPYFNTLLRDLEVSKTGTGWSGVEVEQIKAAGGWVIGNNRAGNGVITGEVVTTYKTDPAGNPDPTFGFLNNVDTSSACREYYVNNFRAKYQQFRLTGGALIRGRDSVNSDALAATAAEFYSNLGSPDFALVQTGISNFNDDVVDFDREFRKRLTVSIDLSQGMAIVSMTIFIISQLRILQLPIQIAFSPES